MDLRWIEMVLKNIHLDGGCCHTKFFQNSGFCPTSLKCCLITLILKRTPCNWSIIYQASHRNAREGCLLKIILRMKRRFMFSSFMPISTHVGQMNSKEMNYSSSFVNEHQKGDRWRLIYCSSCGFFYYLDIWRTHGSQLRYCHPHPAASDTWTEVLSDTFDKPQWNFNSLGQNIAFSCFGEMRCALGKWNSARMVQQIQVFL